VYLDVPFVDPLCDTPSYTMNDALKVAPPPWLRWCWRAYLGAVDECTGGYAAAGERFGPACEAAQAALRAALDDPLCCPQAAPGALAGPIPFPPTLVVTCTGDPLRDEGLACVAALKASRRPAMPRHA
jgi:acetyl esterase/lipase